MDTTFGSQNERDDGNEDSIETLRDLLCIVFPEVTGHVLLSGVPGI